METALMWRKMNLKKKKMMTKKMAEAEILVKDKGFQQQEFGEE
jgi:hypothetical protein